MMELIDLALSFAGIALGMWIAWRRLKPKVDWDINELI